MRFPRTSIALFSAFLMAGASTPALAADALQLYLLARHLGAQSKPAATPRRARPTTRARLAPKRTQPANTKASPKAAGSRDAEQALAELDALEGLEGVKRSVREIKSLLEINRLRKDAGLPAVRPSLHAVFLGNPGTGKTTVARVYAKTLKALGYLSKGHLTEVTASDLIAGYVGQTALKTREVLKKARGGVLFIDEAYSLAGAVGERGDFGAEALAELVKYMEDNRDDLVVVLAGYPEEMRKMIAINPGLKSRIGQHLDFPNYSDESLARIFESMATKSGYKVAPALLRSVAKEIGAHRDEKDFANGRSVRNVLEQSILRQAVRLRSGGARAGKLNRESMMTLLDTDVADSATN